MCDGQILSKDLLYFADRCPENGKLVRKENCSVAGKVREDGPVHTRAQMSCSIRIMACPFITYVTLRKSFPFSGTYLLFVSHVVRFVDSKAPSPVDNCWPQGTLFTPTEDGQRRRLNNSSLWVEFADSGLGSR